MSDSAKSEQEEPDKRGVSGVRIDEAWVFAAR